MYFICPPGITFILVVIGFFSWFLEHGAVPRDLPSKTPGKAGVAEYCHDPQPRAPEISQEHGWQVRTEMDKTKEKRKTLS